MFEDDVLDQEEFEELVDIFRLILGEFLEFGEFIKIMGLLLDDFFLELMFLGQ